MSFVEEFAKGKEYERDDGGCAVTQTRTVKVAVVGASGYTGGELLRLIVGHPKMTLAVVTSEKSAGSPVSAVFPHLASLVPFSFESLAPEAIAARAEAVFFSLPHTKSFAPVAACLTAGKPVVDLSADYRLKNPHSYETWYQTTHPYPKLLEEAVYGLPELHRANGFSRLLPDRGDLATRSAGSQGTRPPGCHYHRCQVRHFGGRQEPRPPLSFPGGTRIRRGL
ncbi:MAG: hypothetical protein E6K69_08970 [Nitrospirae bacterium]|nr:MAG: hypothetical protein E6K69_08970 [Nitrospirota bacterium]